MEQAKLETKPSLALSRHYPVAPEKVWRAWTDPQAIKQWWGPGGNDPVSVAEIDVRIGGRFLMVFGGAQGRDHECAGIYKEVVPNRKLVFTWCWPNSTPERVSQVTILLKPARGGTDFEFRHEQFFDEAARDGHQRGWSESFVKLERYLIDEQRPSLTLTRIYPVAPEKVWRAWIEPDALRSWLGQRDSPVWAAELDVRVGGRYRFAMRYPDGARYEARGVYREMVRHRKLVFTWSWQEGAGAAEALITVLLKPVAAGTELVFTLDPVVDPREPDAWQGDFKRLGQLLQESR